MFAAEQVPPAAGAVTHVIKVRVPNVDAAYIQACDAGAQVVSEPTSYEYGERSCQLEDLAGHRWELTQTERDVQPEQWEASLSRRGEHPCRSTPDTLPVRSAGHRVRPGGALSGTRRDRPRDQSP